MSSEVQRAVTEEVAEMQIVLAADPSPLPVSLHEPIDFERIDARFDEEFAQHLGTLTLCRDCEPKLKTRVAGAKHWLMSGRYPSVTAAASGALQRISCAHRDTATELR